MNSMTGFGRASGRGRRWDIDVEARSVNHRFLSVKISLPEGLSRYEADIDRAVRSRMARGSVNLTVTVKRLGPDPALRPDPRQIREFYRRLDAIRKSLRIKEPVPFQSVLLAPPVWTSPEGGTDDSDRTWSAVKRLVDRAVKDLVRRRAREGQGIRKDILGRLDLIQAATAVILLLAANTSFSGFPMLASMMAVDGFLPRQFANRGDRLVFSNGILILAGAHLIQAFHWVVFVFGAFLTHAGRLDLHLGGALAVFVLLPILTARLRRTGDPVLVPAAAILLGLLGLQLALGVGAFLARFTPIWLPGEQTTVLILPVAHRVTGSLILGALVVLALAKRFVL